MPKYEDKDDKLTITLTEEESNEIRSRRLDWRITDLLFFGSIIVMLAIVFITIIFDLKEPENITWYWIGFMMLIVIPKVFLPRSKFVRWLEKYRW